MTTGMIPESALNIVNLYAPQGTQIPMSQAAAPLGWTSVSTSDASMRYNTSTGGATGGSTGWSSWNFGGTFNINAFGLSLAQMPSHTHGINDPTHNHGDGGHAHAAPGGDFVVIGGGGGNGLAGGGQAFSFPATTGTGFASIGFSATGVSTQANGGSGAIQPNYTTPQVKFVDHILCLKS